MYERSGVVLEKYFKDLFGFDKKNNLKQNFKNYNDAVKEMQNYQVIVKEEEKIIEEFEKVANEIRQIQDEEEKIYKSNIKLEEKRNQLFNSIDEEASSLEKKLDKIEDNIDKNNIDLKELRTDFIQNISIFSVKQKERNRVARKKRTVEANHIAFIEQQKKALENINQEDIKNIKSFLESEEDLLEKELTKIMIDNGKDERVGFNQEVIRKTVETRKDIAKREVRLYIIAYDKLVKLFNEIDNDNVKLNKHQKILRDISVEIAFLDTQKEYIVGFLDNERMTSINGLKTHKEIMKEACHNFDEDVEQINNLYELIKQEISGRVTKKAYKELFNKMYLRNIEEKERNFEQEKNNIKLHTGTIINSNYWRIEGIKNIYEVFQEEVSNKFEKDLSEYKIEEIEEEEEKEIIEEINEEDIIETTKKSVYEIEFEEEEEEEEEIEYEDIIDDNQIEENEITSQEDVVKTEEIEEIGTTDFVEKIRKNSNKNKKANKKIDVEKSKKKENNGLFDRIFKEKKKKTTKEQKRTYLRFSLFIILYSPRLCLRAN